MRLGCDGRTVRILFKPFDVWPGAHVGIGLHTPMNREFTLFGTTVVLCGASRGATYVIYCDLENPLEIRRG